MTRIEWPWLRLTACQVGKLNENGVREIGIFSLNCRTYKLPSIDVGLIGAFILWSWSSFEGQRFEFIRCEMFILDIILQTLTEMSNITIPVKWKVIWRSVTIFTVDSGKFYMSRSIAIRFPKFENRVTQHIPICRPASLFQNLISVRCDSNKPQ